MGAPDETWRDRWRAPLWAAAGIALSSLFLAGVAVKEASARLRPASLAAALTERPPPLSLAAVRDPDGPAPPSSREVTGEDGRQATLRIDPDDAWRGAADAAVTIVTFTDFDCAYCRRASSELARLHDAYADQVLFVVKHYPMDPECNPAVQGRHAPRACAAADAAACARDQGVFWAFHDLAFKNQHQLGDDDLRRYAAAAGADLGAFDRCLREGVGRARVLADARQGADLAIEGAPRIWIGGRLHRVGTTAEQMARNVELALGADTPAAVDAARRLAAAREHLDPIPENVPEMQDVAHDGLRFRIDTFEASVQDGEAVGGQGRIPAHGMSWFAARDACIASGRRLCTEEEWVTACQGARAIDDDGDGAFADDRIEGSTYPYGDHHDPRRCWDGKPADFRPLYTGEMPGCVSADGVYDLTGNVEEWVGATPESAVLLGGAFDTPRDHARCYRRNHTFGPGYASRRTGFRCCADAPPAGD